MSGRYDDDDDYQSIFDLDKHIDDDFDEDEEELEEDAFEDYGAPEIEDFDEDDEYSNNSEEEDEDLLGDGFYLDDEVPEDDM